MLGKPSLVVSPLTLLVIWKDVRSFGQVFAYGSAKKNGDASGGVSVGVRGPVSIHIASSLSPVDIESFQITKSVNGETTKDGSRSSDTMGMKHFIRFGLYEIKGSINVQLAEKTGDVRWHTTEATNPRTLPFPTR